MEEIHYCTLDVNSKDLPTQLVAVCGISVVSPGIFPWQATHGRRYCRRCQQLHPEIGVTLVRLIAERSVPLTIAEQRPPALIAQAS